MGFGLHELTPKAWGRRNILNPHYLSKSVARGLAVVGSFAALTALTLADQVIPVFTTRHSAAAVVTSTLNVHPQIQPPNAAVKRIEENDRSNGPITDPLNSLVPGGISAGSRGAPKVAFSGPGFTGYVPPDCDMGVGPDHVVAVVNLSIAFYTKTGVKTFQQNMDQNGFWSGVGGNSQVYSDPKVFYDAGSQRWFVYMIEVNGLGGGTELSHVLVAVSDDSNPNGVWRKYAFDAKITVGGNDLWMDYPMVGVNKDGICICGNMFGFTAGGGVEEFMVVPKAPLLTGAPANATIFQDNSVGSVQPARSWDTTVTRLFCMARGNGSDVKVFAISNAGGAPTLAQTSVTVPSYDNPSPAPSSGGNTLDTLGGRFLNCWFRDGKMVAAHTITTAGNSTDRVRWYQVAVNNWPASGAPSLVQSGEISPSSSVTTHMPAICSNAAGDISVVYTRSSSSIAADLCMSSRFGTDPAGQMGAPVLLRSSTGTYGAGRWGDFFSCVVDPTDELTFWGFGMEILNGAWQTSVHSWQVSTAGSVGSTINADSISTYVGTELAGDPASISTSDSIYYQIGSIGIPQFGQAAGADVAFTVPSDTKQISVKLQAIAGISGGTNMVWLFNWNTGQYVLVGSTPLAASGSASKTIVVRATDVPSYVGPGGQVLARVRGHFPLRPFNNSVPNPFTYRIDVLQLLIR
jgi:hypothetical protein